MTLSKPEHILKEFIVKSGVIYLRTDGIITFEPDTSIKGLKMEYFHENLEVYKKLTKDGKKPFLTDNRISLDYTAEQKRFMQEQLPNYFTKVGVILNSDFNKFIFNAFLYLYKPKVNVKTFANIDKAILWLNEN